jgi:hypothetical protein
VGLDQAARSAFLQKVQALTELDVLKIGASPEDIVRQWTNQVAGNQDIVLTGKRRAHYLERHPELTTWQAYLAEAVLQPDEVHRNQQVASTAIFYKQVDAAHYLRVVVAMQAVPGRFKHSIITWRLARANEVIANRARRIWPTQ